MFSIILALATPDALACSPAPNSALWSYPADQASDVAVNQPLQFRITAGGFGDIDFQVWNSNTEEPIDGMISYSCSNDPNGWNHCLATFLPDGGNWQTDAQVSWSASPDEDFGDPALTGSFTTTDWMIAGELPSTVDIDAEMVAWKPVENSCDSVEAIEIQMSLDLDFIQTGSIIQIMKEIKGNEAQGDAAPEPYVAHQLLVREDTELDFAFDIGATENEQCFNVWVYSPDGGNMDQFEGPCLQWNSHVPGSGTGCATSNGSRSQGMAWAALFLALSLRRRRDS